VVSGLFGGVNRRVASEAVVSSSWQKQSVSRSGPSGVEELNAIKASGMFHISRRTSRRTEGNLRDEDERQSSAFEAASGNEKQIWGNICQLI